ncbi:MAG: CarD family transcriptional regulator, partial [Bdellovibrionota bacterium]
EKISEFDETSQRTLNDAASLKDEVTIPPAREVLINSKTLSTLREKLKTSADDRGITRAVRDPVMASIQDGIYHDHSDGWAPFAYPEPSTLIDHLPEHTEIVWVDELTCLQSWDEFLEDQLHLAAESPVNGVVLPAAADLFLFNPALEAKIKNYSRVFLDRIDIADLSTKDDDPEAHPEAGIAKTSEFISEKHHVFVRNNGDLEKGSRTSLGEIEPKLQNWLKQKFKVVIFAATNSQLERIRYLLSERKLVVSDDLSLVPGFISLRLGVVTEGFRWPAEGLVLLTEGEVMGVATSRRHRSSSPVSKSWAGLQVLTDLSPGDLIVHLDHGIGKYSGLTRLDLSGAPSDFLLLEYAKGDKLYLPVYRLNVIQKYAGSAESVALDRLGGNQFEKAKDKVRDAVKKLAVDLVQIYAERKVRTGYQLHPRDSAYREFEAKFPFDETPDQLKAIEDVMGDMESARVTDRLVCGDV